MPRHESRSRVRTTSSTSTSFRYTTKSPITSSSSASAATTKQKGITDGATREKKQEKRRPRPQILVFDSTPQHTEIKRGHQRTQTTGTRKPTANAAPTRKGRRSEASTSASAKTGACSCPDCIDATKDERKQEGRRPKTETQSRLQSRRQPMMMRMDEVETHVGETSMWVYDRNHKPVKQYIEQPRGCLTAKKDSRKKKHVSFHPLADVYHVERLPWQHWKQNKHGASES